MNNQLLPSTPSRDRLHTLKLILSCFGLSAGLMAIIYFCIGVPFFGNSVLVLDLNGQYVYFFESLHDVIYNADASLLYSWSRTLGGEYMGIYAYYLASPFSWLVALMPSAIITESLYVMILLKIGCAGASMGWYLHKTYPTTRQNVLIFSALYALCAWSLSFGNNVMWLDALILFPLVIYGADLLISGRNYIVYTLALALTILSHYYMGYMVCLFLVLYFFYHHVAMRDRADFNPRGERAHFLLSGLRYLFFTILAVGISAVIVFCAYYSLTFGKDTFTDPTYEFTFKLTFLDVLYKLFPGAVDTVRREGLPFLYCGTATLFGAAAFAVSPKFKTKEKAAAGLLLLILTLCFSVSLIDIWWHGGQEPNWLNYRYSFMFSFVLLVIGYRGFERLRNLSSQFLAVVPGALGIILVILQQEGYGKGYEYTEEIFPKAYSYDLLFYFLAPIIIGAVFLAILYYKKQKASKMGSLALTLTILCETVAVGVLSHVGLACDVGYSLRKDYADFMDRVSPAVEYIQELDSSFYRMDKDFHRQPADAIALEMRGLSSTTSTLNRHTLKLVDQLGYAGGSYWSQYSGGNPVTDMLLGVKYVLSDNTLADALYQRIYTDEKGEAVYGYLNPYALSLGFAVNDAVLELDFDDYPSPMELLNDLTAAMTGKDELRPFLPIETEDPALSGIDRAYTTGKSHYIYKKTDPESTDASITYTLTADKDGLCYLFFPTDYPRECTLYVDGVESGTAMGNDSDCIIPLGNFKAGSSHEIKLVPLQEKAYVATDCAYFYTLDEELFKGCYESLKDSQFHIDRDYKEDHLTGSITVREENTLLFTSIPYDAGWIIKVDGKEVTPYLSTVTVYDEKTGEAAGTEQQPYQDALTVLRLTKGEHTLSFEYRPDCYLYGSAISLISLGVFLLIVAADYLLIRPLVKRAQAKKALAASTEEPAAEPIPQKDEPQEEKPIAPSKKKRRRGRGKKKEEGVLPESPSTPPSDLP